MKTQSSFMRLQMDGKIRILFLAYDMVVTSSKTHMILERFKVNFQKLLENKAHVELL